jgi:uncharacterized metal-binding protein
MASGKNHDRAILFTSPLVLTLGAYQFGWEVGIVAGAAHFLGGWFLSPDLDLVSKPYKRWGFLRFVWVPYQRLIPRHRHWLSHAPVVGSAVRLVYLACWIAPLWAIPEVRAIQWAGITLTNMLAFLAGVEISALNHLLLDGMLIPLPSGVKHRLKG